MSFRGSYVALITPFQKNGRIDWKKVEALVDWHVQSGTDGIVCGATTGEGPTLSDGERNKLAQVCIAVAAKRVKVIISTGLNDTRRSVKATEQAGKLGADGCLAVTPYYNKPTQRGCVLHFREIGKAGLPVIIYHNPPRTALKLALETIQEISRLPHLAGIKDCSGDIELIRGVKKSCPGFAILSGDDDFTGPLMRAGGTGAISVIGNVVPEGWSRAIHAALEGKWEAAEILFQRYMPLCKAHFIETNPQCVKFSMSWLGKCEGLLRLPLVEPLEKTKRAIKAALVVSGALPQFRVLPAKSGSISSVS